MRIGAILSRQRFVVLLVVGTALTYLNSFQGAFLFDDATILVDSRLENLSRYLFHLGGMIRPALKFSFLVDRYLWGENPAGYHLLNLFLHLGSGLFLYAIVSRLANEAPARRGGAPATAVPFWTALLFLVHPIGTETVTYLSGRATGLMAFFYLASLHLYLRATGMRPVSSVAWTYLGAIGCFLLALLSKEIAVTFPLALLLTECVARGRRGADLRNVFLRFQLPFWGVLTAFLAAAMFHPRYVYLLDVSLGIRPVYENLLIQSNVVVYALSLFLLPGRLTLEHDLPLYTSVFAWPTPASLALLLLLLTAAVRLVRRNPLAAFGLFWFFLQLLPTNSVLPRYDLLSERNLYLAAPGLFLALVSLGVAGAAKVGRWIERPASARALRILPWALVSLLVALTLARNALYADPVAFWSDAARKAPGKARPHVNLGHAYYQAGAYDRAIDEFRLALALDRDNPVAQANLLAAWRRKGETSAEQR